MVKQEDTTIIRISKQTKGYLIRQANYLDSMDDVIRKLLRDQHKGKNNFMGDKD